MPDDNQDDITFDEERNERHRVLRERGYDPEELTLEEQEDILADDFDDDEDNNRLGNVMPADERDGTDA
jgi:hypothetical protein